LQMRNSGEPPTVPGNGNGHHLSAIRQPRQSEWWN